MDAEDIGHRSRPSDDRQAAFIEILEGLLRGLTLHFPHDRFGGICALLHCHLRDARQRIPMGVQRESQISDDIDVWKFSHRKVGANFDLFPRGQSQPLSVSPTFSRKEQP